jgi:hypothetical protein
MLLAQYLKPNVWLSARDKGKINKGFWVRRWKEMVDGFVRLGIWFWGKGVIIAFAWRGLAKGSGFDSLS